MDTTMIIIIAVIVVIVITVIALFIFSGNEKGKKDGNTENSDNSSPKENVTAKRFQQVLSDESISNKMNEEAGEILTKYTSGSGEGIPEVEKLLEGDPNNVDLLDWLAFMYYSNDNIDKAIETYKRALSIKSDNENQHYYLANSYYKKGMMSDAKKEWSEVIRLNPSSKIAKNAQERIDYLTSQGK
ncbi:MAG: tetratricopeptide repeat protein [Candidatus Riflebacteria bacterium]|nr:tetratricopeptide repeat protein [Candidatus Riflebacteria bacterium]